ncbi:hypothetical protein M434DRAFT_237543 [Hypoxylon sp. CO27-5]|nr:hypothetical protein M434DRAFT_237543 [Hypoxylon sp. CO27-5]
MSSPEPETEAVPSESSTDDVPGPGKTICDICLAHIYISSLTTLPCGHSFHPVCINKWTQVTELRDWEDGRMCCPICRAELVYECGCIISENHLRPGVTILWQELSLHCQSYHADIDDHSVSEFEPPFGLRTIAALDAELEDSSSEEETSSQEDAGAPENAATEHPQGPQNIVQGDQDPRDEGEPHDQLPQNPQEHQGPQEPQVVEQAKRPRHHNFLFGTNIDEPGEAPESFEKYVLNKKTAVLALESGETQMVDATVNRTENRG